MRINFKVEDIEVQLINQIEYHRVEENKQRDLRNYSQAQYHSNREGGLEDIIFWIEMEKKKYSKVDVCPYSIELDKIEQLTQSQRSTRNQLDVLIDYANKLGLYDAADYLKQK